MGHLSEGMATRNGAQETKDDKENQVLPYNTKQLYSSVLPEDKELSAASRGTKASPEILALDGTRRAERCSEHSV